MSTVSVPQSTDDAAASSVKFDSVQSHFAPDGMVSNITGNKIINDTTAGVIKTQNHRMGKFMREMSKTDFDGLQEVPQSDGNTIWVADMAIDNQDFNFVLNQAEILQSIELTEVQNDQEIQEKAAHYNIDHSKTYVEIDGKKYFVRMNVPMHFGTGENNDALINLGVFIIGESLMSTAVAGVIASFGIDAFKDVTKKLATAPLKILWALVSGVAKASFRFVTTLIVELASGATLRAAYTAARTAAGTAWDSAWEGITKTTWRYAGGVALIAVLIYLIITFILHRTYQTVYFYNLTSYDIEFDFPYKDEGDYHNLPTTSIDAAVDRKGPGGINLGTWYNGAAFQYQSDSEFHGLAYTMRFKLKDPETQNIVKTFSCLFDVPFSTDNSLFASTSDAVDYKSYFSSNAGVHKTTQFSASDGQQEIIVTYDFLNGQHEDPETGNKQYLYNSLVVIRDVVGA